MKNSKVIAIVCPYIYMPRNYSGEMPKKGDYSVLWYKPWTRNVIVGRPVKSDRRILDDFNYGCREYQEAVPTGRYKETSNKSGEQNTFYEIIIKVTIDWRDPAVYVTKKGQSFLFFRTEDEKICIKCSQPRSEVQTLTVWCPENAIHFLETFEATEEIYSCSE